MPVVWPVQPALHKEPGIILDASVHKPWTCQNRSSTQNWLSPVLLLVVTCRNTKVRKHGETVHLLGGTPPSYSQSSRPCGFHDKHAIKEVTAKRLRQKCFHANPRTTAVAVHDCVFHEASSDKAGPTKPSDLPISRNLNHRDAEPYSYSSCICVKATIL